MKERNKNINFNRIVLFTFNQKIEINNNEFF